MTTPDLSALIALCKANGVRRIKTGDVELEFGGPATVSPETMQQFRDAIAGELAAEPDPLFWSAPGMVPPAPEEPPAPKTARGRRAAQ
jgi:hypothetical protein